MTRSFTRARWLRIGALGWSAAVACPLLLPLADLSFSSVVPVVQALWPGWLLLGVLTLVGCLGLRQWAAAGIVVAALVAGLLPGTLTGSGAEPAGSGETLTVLAANVEFSQGDPQVLADAVRELEVDVLVLLEVHQRYLQRLRDLALDTDLPHGWDRPVAGGATGTTILTRVPQQDEPRWPDPFDYRFQMPTVRLALDGREVVVRAVHTVPPAPGPAPAWRTELRALEGWVDAVPSDVPLVLAGDFNAGRAHPAFRDVADGFAVAPGRGSRTWPEDRPLGPFVGIDHVLARGLAPVASGSVSVPGSDHRAVWGRLGLTARRPS